MKIFIRISLFIFILSIFFSTSLTSQSLGLISKVTLVKGNIGDYLKGNAILKNISNGSLTIKVSVSVIIKHEGHHFSCSVPFTCTPFTTSTFTSDPFTLQKNDSTDHNLSFNCSTDSSDISRGISKLHITCFNASNPQDNVSYDLTFDVAISSVADYFNFDDNSFTLYPNPASNLINFNYTLQYKNVTSKIEIYNSNGSLVQTVNDNNTLDLNMYTSGVYYSRLLLDGKPQTTKKFVVSH